MSRRWANVGKKRYPYHPRRQASSGSSPPLYYVIAGITGQVINFGTADEVFNILERVREWAVGFVGYRGSLPLSL